MDCSLPGPSVHGISQGRRVEQVPSLGYLPNPGDLLDPRIKPTSSFPVLGRDSLLLSHLGCCCSVAKSCPPLCNPTDCSPPGSSVHGDSPGKDTVVGCHALLQGIFPTQGSNPGLLHCGQITETPGQPKNMGVGSLSLLQEIFPTQESNWGLLHCRWSWVTRETHYLLEFAQILVHWVGNIQPSHPLLPPSLFVLNLSQHQGLFQRISSSYQVAKVLEFRLQYQLNLDFSYLEKD